ncbi:MAG: hypothetical protein JW745_01155 [Sedimentisphaerales bacterium]|nr:hypothetical protein [Sedimentisphaerales bacterium]MBN2844170.1 hypothetical protein [Sedimentisphaerales bacterium]
MSVTLVQGQTYINISDASQTYSNLNNYNVTMTGNSELHLTAANPLTSSTINLNSSDSWLFLEYVKPSVAISNYLSQVKVNGANAINNSNVRVTQYINGAVIIPHSPSFKPLEVHNSYNCSGTAMSLGLYTYYTGSSLGSYDNNISSFRLKRGYMATFANNINGTGPSKVFIAQDSDLIMNIMPEKLDNEVSFIRVFPWRWVNKKGWCGSDSGAFSSLNCSWYYNWDNAANSTIDAEYVPMRSKRWWNSWSNITSKTNATHVLGFNEPESLDQHSDDGGVITTDNAIEMWPNLMASGLRIGSPATTDGGLSWLYEFIDKADALDYRVDFVAIHFYKGGWNATQLYNWLHDIHVRTGRPLWVTEFNNGANWTCCEPTLESNATTIDSFLTVMDNAPFIERYAIYNWVGATRMMINDSGAITAAGAIYRDNVAPAAFNSIPADGSGRSTWYKFDDNTNDSLGYGNHAIAKGQPVYTTGRSGKAMAFDGNNDYVVVPSHLAGGKDFSFAAWVYWNGSSQWQRIFDFGRNTNAYMLLTPRSGGNTLRFTITQNGNGAEQRIERSTQLATGSWQHVAVTLNSSTNNARMYVNGSLVSSGTITLDPSDLKAMNCYLGKSMFASDPYFNGRLDDVRITNYVLSAAQVAALASSSTANTAPVFVTDPLIKDDAEVNRYYQESLSFDAGDLNTETRPAFAKVSGPAWLNVGSGGAIYGTPGITDLGQNSFRIKVTDSYGLFSEVDMLVNVNGFGPEMRYPFDTNVTDIINGNNGTVYGSPVYNSGKIGNAIDLDGTDDYVTLPAIFNDTTDFTFAAWLYWEASSSWQRVFDFGSGTNAYMFLSPRSGSGTLRFAITTFGAEEIIERSSPLPLNQWTHVAVTLNGSTGSLYVNGSLAGTNIAMKLRPKDLNATKYYLGKSQFSSDPYFNGKIDDLRIYNYALPASSIIKLAGGTANTAPSFYSSSISSNDGREDKAYTESIIAKAGYYGFDLEGDTLTYSKLSGPDWLAMAGNGALSGTPANSNVGQNIFGIKCQDGSALSATATLNINVANIFSGTEGLADFVGLAQYWGISNCEAGLPCNSADLNEDQQIDIIDLEILAQKWLLD